MLAVLEPYFASDSAITHTQLGIMLKRLSASYIRDFFKARPNLLLTLIRAKEDFKSVI